LVHKKFLRLPHIAHSERDSAIDTLVPFCALGSEKMGIWLALDKDSVGMR
jgi:hypothetical protein